MTSSATQSLPQAQSIEDVTLGVTLVDVTQWTGTVDDRVRGRLDVVLLCFGSHKNGRCALRSFGQPPDPHGIVLVVEPSIGSHNRLARRYRHMFRAEVPVTIFDGRDPGR